MSKFNEYLERAMNEEATNVTDIEIANDKVNITVNGKKNAPIEFGKFATSELGLWLKKQGINFADYTAPVDPPVDFQIRDGKLVAKNPDSQQQTTQPQEPLAQSKQKVADVNAAKDKSINQVDIGKKNL